MLRRPFCRPHFICLRLHRSVFKRGNDVRWRTTASQISQRRAFWPWNRRPTLHPCVRIATDNAAAAYRTSPVIVRPVAADISVEAAFGFWLHFFDALQGARLVLRLDFGIKTWDIQDVDIGKYDQTCHLHSNLFTEWMGCFWAVDVAA